MIETCFRCGAVVKVDRDVRYDVRTGDDVTPDCDYEVIKKVSET